MKNFLQRLLRIKSKNVYRLNFNFISLNTRYTGNYDWTSAPLALRHLGHNIQNSNTKQYNGQINMNTLYNKVPFLKKWLNKINSYVSFDSSPLSFRAMRSIDPESRRNVSDLLLKLNSDSGSRIKSGMTKVKLFQ